MIKRILLALTVGMMWVLSTYATEPTRGYRGFLEWNTELISSPGIRYIGDGYNHHEWISITDRYCYLGLSSSHGFQFNPHFFLGAGLWIQASTEEGYGGLNFPVFIHGRTDWTFGGIPLYGDLRLGCNIFSRKIGGADNKLIIAPTVGYRLDWGRKVCANFGIGLALQGCDTGNNHITWRPTPALRLGIEF